MSGRQIHQDWMQAEALCAVFDALTRDGQEVRFVGGCVRDSLAGRPVKDIDLATPDPPEVVMEKLAEAGLKAVPTGIAHGTVTAVSGGEAFEVTTLRRDLKTDGRHAKVGFIDDWLAEWTSGALPCHEQPAGRRHSAPRSPDRLRNVPRICPCPPPAELR